MVGASTTGTSISSGSSSSSRGGIPTGSVVFSTSGSESQQSTFASLRSHPSLGIHPEWLCPHL
jgi:hypothetical protein